MKNIARIFSKRIITILVIFSFIISFTLVSIIGIHTSKNKEIQLKSNKIEHLIPTPLILFKEIKLPIVMHHYVEYITDQNDKSRMRLNITPFALNQELKLFQDNGYETFFVKEIPMLFSSGHIPKKGVVLTFDDGYEDIYLNAYPLLKQYHTKATLYIITDDIGKKGFLTDEQIKTMLDSGLIEIGAHTMSHPDLKHLTLQQAKKEIVDSKKILEDEFNISVKTFAYPGGSLNDQVVDMVKQASYEAAVSTKPGVILSLNNLFILPRIRPGFVTFSSVIELFDKLHF